METNTKTNNIESSMATDSLTFGQLKKIVAQKRSRPQDPKFEFKYTERGSLVQELEDWHIYTHEPHLITISEVYRDEHSHNWSTSTTEKQQMVIRSALDDLNNADLSIRSRGSAVLSYIGQGCYVEARDKQHHLQCILANTGLLANADILQELLTALQGSIKILNTTSYIAGADHVEDITQNLCTALYFVLAASHKLQGLGQTLRGLKTSLVAFFLEILSQLCDGQDNRLSCLSVRHIALLLRQCILCCLGGRDALMQCKDYRRRKAQLPLQIDKISITTTPMDYSNFRMELIAKYPSYIPPPLSNDTPSEPAFPSGPPRENLDLPIYTDGQWTATPAPSPPPSPKGKKSMYTTDQTLPFLLPLQDSQQSTIPSSIEEAAALFRSRQRTSVSLVELWQEQEHFVRSERGWVPHEQKCIESVSSADDDNQARARLQEVERIYKECLPHLQSCAAGLISQMWNSSSHNLSAAGLQADKELDSKIEESVANTRGWLFNDKPGSSEPVEQNAKSARENEDCRDMEILLKGITGSIILLLKWFRTSHILQFEYFSQVLIDADWIHTFHQAMMSLNPVVNVHVQHDDSRRAYFTVCNSLSEAQPLDHSDEDDEEDAKYDEADDNELDGGPRNDFKRDLKPDNEDSMTKKMYNWNVFYDLINLLAITQKLVKKKIHRNYQLVQAKTWLHLRRPLRISHDLAQLYCLKLYKGQVPLCSRKWRMSNMKVITQIYMSCRPELREDWISGTDQDTDLEEAKQHEAAIRALIMFFNSRRYPEQMGDLGFRSEDDEDSDDDFFGTEVARMP